MLKEARQLAQMKEEQKKKCPKCGSNLHFDKEDEYYDCINHHCTFSMSNIDWESKAQQARLQ